MPDQPLHVIAFSDSPASVSSVVSVQDRCTMVQDPLERSRHRPLVRLQAAHESSVAAHSPTVPAHDHPHAHVLAQPVGIKKRSSEAAADQVNAPRTQVVQVKSARRRGG
eukprot:6197103-Pleurochrysis_carterae.AAC.1